MTLEPEDGTPLVPAPTDPPITRRARPPQTPEELVTQIKETADKLLRDRAALGDIKLLNTAVKELRYCFKVFAALRGRRKVTVFGSARTKIDHATFTAAVTFGRRMREAGYMVVTGAASGIMEAGHVGAGRESSIGINIILPFEQGANAVIAGDAKLMHLKYFFTRKLLFIKESDAIVLFPGGFGTHDEGFEALTLLQTGKSHLFPLVMVDEPGGDYWTRWRDFVEGVLLERGLIGPQDRALYKITDDIDEAVRAVTGFYRNYHSMRYVKHDLVLRLLREPSAALLDRIQSEFRDIVTSGTFTVTAALPPEANEESLATLPRLRFRFNRHDHGRLRMLIDVLNGE
jgi:uncharacterized protein (TIGR00730 family)